MSIFGQSGFNTGAPQWSFGFSSGYDPTNPPPFGGSGSQQNNDNNIAITQPATPQTQQSSWQQLVSTIGSTVLGVFSILQQPNRTFNPAPTTQGNAAGTPAPGASILSMQNVLLIGALLFAGIAGVAIFARGKA